MEKFYWMYALGNRKVAESLGRVITRLAMVYRHKAIRFAIGTQPDAEKPFYLLGVDDYAIVQDEEIRLNALKCWARYRRFAPLVAKLMLHMSIVSLHLKVLLLPLKYFFNGGQR